MNTWLRPLITFAVGIILGVGGMYLTGVRPNPIPLGEGVPDVAGISGAGLSLVKNNKIVANAELRLALLGVIGGVKNNEITLLNDDSAPIKVAITEQTNIFELPQDQKGQPKILKLQELQNNEVVRVFGRLEGSKVVANDVIRELPSSPSNQ